MGLRSNSGQQGGMHMSVSQPNVTAEPRELDCAGVSQVTFSFQAASELLQSPADMALIVDVSGSLLFEMDEVKLAAKELIRVVAEASGGLHMNFGGGTRMALISFSDQATVEMDLTDDGYALSLLVNKFQAAGGTNHRAAFIMAEKVLSKDRSKARKVIMFTDGETGDAAWPETAAKRLRDDGVEIYCIGLLANTQEIRTWASEPKDEHVGYTEDPTQLSKVFREIASEAALTGAHDALLQVELTPDFQLVNRSWYPNPGTVQAIGTQKLEWQVGSVESPRGPKTCSLFFRVQHIGAQGGQKPFAAAVSYRDREGHALAFAPPELQVNCPPPDPPPPDPPTPDPPPPNPQFLSFVIPGCQDAFYVQLEDVAIPPPSPKPDSQANSR